MAIYKAITKGSSKLPVGHAQPDKAVKYLLYQSDEKGRYPRDDRGDLIPRTGFVTAINADKDNFCDDCKDYAAKFKVNQTYSDLKYKHYVQGFSPADSELLTKDECHQMGVEFAKTFFGDFPVLVVTHFEQEAEIGGAHWHNHFLVYNCNVRTGKKLDTSGARMKEQKRYIITQALAHGLSDKELKMRDGQLLPSKNPDRISSAEYYDRKYHQKLMDREKKLHPDQRVRQHTYYTRLQELRIVIASAYQQTGGDRAAFRSYLREVYGVETKTVRGGELSYLHPDRAQADGTGWVRGRTLGNAYTGEALQNGDYQSHYRRITGRGDRAESADDGARRSDVRGDGRAAEIRQEEGRDADGISPDSFHALPDGHDGKTAERAEQNHPRIEEVADSRTDADRSRKGRSL